jgi:hypothetical protein
MRDSRVYRQIWRIVDGAVFDALYTHQEYLTEKGRQSARSSIVKRVTGSVVGYVEQSTRGRSGGSPAADRVPTNSHVEFPHGAIFAVSKWRAVATAVRQFLFGVKAP